MKERPILFSAPMVRALLNMTKTQTRRVVHNPHRNDGGFVLQDFGNGFWPYRSHDGESGCYLDRQKDGDYYSEAPLRCPYGRPGDRLWVRETFAHIYRDNAKPDKRRDEDVAYKADHHGLDEYAYGIWKPSIHMPRWASRITLEVTGVRVERLQEISEADAVAEGVVELPMAALPPKSLWAVHASAGCELHAKSAAGAYAKLWDSINGPGSWDLNPWVWAISFQKVTP